MPIINRGITKCDLCHKVIHTDELVRSFQEFIYNEFDKYRIFSGGIFHNDCFLNHPISDEFLDIYSKIEDEYESKICHISEELIEFDKGLDPDNHIYVGRLVEDPKHPLFKFNYIHLNLRYFEFWQEKEIFLSLLNELSKKKGWSSVKRLISHLESKPRPDVKPEILRNYLEYKNRKRKDRDS